LLDVVQSTMDNLAENPGVGNTMGDAQLLEETGIKTLQVERSMILNVTSLPSVRA